MRSIRTLLVPFLALGAYACSASSELGATFEGAGASGQTTSSGVGGTSEQVEGGSTNVPLPGAGGASGGPTGESTPVSSLSLEQVWYLTSDTPNSLVDFRSGTPVVTCGQFVGDSDGFEGTAVFTDPKTGDLLFYTDGRAVFNGQTNAMLENGSGLTGDISACEPGLIAPKNTAGQNEFYVFTNSSNYSQSGAISYSIIDLSAGPNGTVTLKNELLLQGSPGEALDLVPHTNGEDFWVLSYDTAATVKAFLVNATEVNKAAVASPTGITGFVLRGSINHTLDYDHLLLAMNFGGTSGGIATADIDRSSGLVSNVQTFVTGDLGYHASFSADGTKVYYVRGSEGWEGSAYQFDLVTKTETAFGGVGFAAAKLAPDQKVYWSGYNRTSLGVVNHPNELGAAAGFVADGLFLNGCQSGYGVPNQTASYLKYLPQVPK